MTIVIPTQSFEVDAAWRIAEARTLQELLEVGGAVLGELRVDHAVIYSLAADDRWAYLPLISLAPELEDTISRCLRSGLHPGLWDARAIVADLMAENDVRATANNVVSSLQTRFGVAGLRQVYNLRVLTPGGRSALFEVARIGASIDATQLRDLETIGQQLIDRLPAFFWAASGGSNGSPLVYRVT